MATVRKSSDPNRSTFGGECLAIQGGIDLSEAGSMVTFLAEYLLELAEGPSKGTPESLAFDDLMDDVPQLALCRILLFI